MTRAKRYEGEKLRGEAWHRALSWTAYRRGQVAAQELKPLLGGKYLVRTREKYNAEMCEYDIEFTMYEGTDNRGVQVWSGAPLLTHVEPWLEAPSDHLKTKIVLITGGTDSA